ncbi:MAG: hypothetical protein AAF791_01105 [Bacteroidota bacterium]
MFVLYLDPFHLGDPLFATSLARDLRARLDAGGGGLVIVHGTGEAGERAIEALGEEPIREGGALTLDSVRAATEAERAGRDENRRLVDTLNEAGVPAVRVLASDRGLVQPDGSMERSQWVRDLASRGAVPVVLAFRAGGDDPPRDLDPAALAAELAGSLGNLPVFALTSRAVETGTDPVAWRDVPVPDTEALARIGFGGARLLAGRRAAIRVPGDPEGVQVAVEGT